VSFRMKRPTAKCCQSAICCWSVPSNGQNEGHTRVPSPRAPSLIAVNKRSGDVVWRAIGAGAQVLHGQWSSPVAANVNGRIQVLFGGGDGWLRAYEAASGHEVWRFDGNPKDARWLPRPGVFRASRSLLHPSSPTAASSWRWDRVLARQRTVSDYAISPNGQGDVTASRLLWTSREVGRVVGTPIAKDGLLYVGTWAERFIVWTRRPAPTSGSTRRTRPFGEASCWPATGCTSGTLEAA
jgi:outer membrane protein assembly factor BamB